MNNNPYKNSQRKKIMDSEEYAVISDVYRGKYAKRSGRPYMAHIDEGLSYMLDKGMSMDAMKAFCLHPVFQEDKDLKFAASEIKKRAPIDPYILLLAMEYRRAANSFLSAHYDKYLSSHESGLEIELSPLEEVNDMLRADKVQNFSDYLRFHYLKYQNLLHLRGYFEMWLDRLDVSYRVVKVEDDSGHIHVLEVK